MAERRESGLRRRVGLRQLASVLFVNLVMAVFVALGVVADEALGLTPLVFVVTGTVFLLTMLAYVEGTAMLPQAGGAAGFARRGLGELFSFFAAWALILDYLILVVLTAYFSVHYLGSIPGMSWLLKSPADTYVTGAFIVGVALLALRGTRASAKLGIMLALVALGAQLLLAALGFALVFDPHLIAAHTEIGVTPTWHGILFALPIAMIGFTGLDTVANLGEELDSPGRDVPRPLIWSAVVSVAVFVTMGIVALNALPVTGSGEAASTPLGRADGWVDRPVIGIVEALDLPTALEYAMRSTFGLLAASVLLLAASTAMAGMGRTAYFMARHRQAPSALFSTDRRTGVPRRAIALLTGVALLFLAVTVSVSDSAVVLAQVYAFGATFTAFIAGLAILRLRMVEPELERPWTAPGNVVVRGRRVPVLIVLGTTASFAMWVLVIATHDSARVVGLAWMILGFVAYATYRLTHGLPLARRADPRELVVPDIDARAYRRLLVAVRPEPGMLYGAGDAEVVGLAHKLLDADDPRPTQVTVMMVHELPLVDPLDAPLGDVERHTMRRLSKIRDAAATLDLRLSSSVARARAAGRAICQEAQRRDADAVLLATRRKQRPGDDPFGKCIAYVMRHAPCDVVVLSLPEESLRRARSLHIESIRARAAASARPEE
ncbi:MAG: Basic amino acid/polyamine antiporter, family [Thermoleophilia bacterium]|nr:Basic amino acid/polyamine antiporter, family [Thermoleophilia bacterium]